jgi:hypothetical protein
MRERSEAGGDDSEKGLIEVAMRYGLQAFDGQEVRTP